MGISGVVFVIGVGYLIFIILGMVFFLKNKGLFKFCIFRLDKRILFEVCFNGLFEMVG